MNTMVCNSYNNKSNHFIINMLNNPPYPIILALCRLGNFSSLVSCCDRSSSVVCFLSVVSP